MNNFERIKNMTVDELAEFLWQKYNVCEKDMVCSKCKNQDWCNCYEQEEYKEWLMSDRK